MLPGVEDIGHAGGGGVGKKLDASALRAIDGLETSDQLKEIQVYLHRLSTYKTRLDNYQNVSFNSRTSLAFLEYRFH